MPGGNPYHDAKGLFASGAANAASHNAVFGKRQPGDAKAAAKALGLEARARVDAKRIAAVHAANAAARLLKK